MLFRKTETHKERDRGTQRQKDRREGDRESERDVMQVLIGERGVYVRTYSRPSKQRHLGIGTQDRYPSAKEVFVR